MRPIVLVVGTGALCAALLGCHSSEMEDDAESEAEPESDPEPLDLSVDGISVSDGEVRIDATFVEGSADVSVWSANAECERKEIGHGIATRTGFTWRLDGADLSDAIRCNLLVRVRVVDEGVRHRKEQELPVMLLDVGGELRKEQADPSIEDSSSGEYVAPDEDVARDILRRRPMGLTRSPLHAVIQVGQRSVELFPDPPPERSELEPSSEGDTFLPGPPTLPELP